MTKLVRVFSTVDESMVLSMLSSAEIEAVADSTNFQRIQYGSMYNELAGTVISVDAAFEKEAKEIVRGFIENRKRQIAEEALSAGRGTAGKKTFKAVISALFAPALTGSTTSQGHSPLPELLA